MEETDFTFDQLKEEYNALKETLSKQEIVNDRLMRETMKAKVRSIKSNIIISVACAIFVMVLAPFTFHYNPVVNASWYFVIMTEILMAFCIFREWKFNHKVQGSDLSCCDMLTFNKEVKRMKENYEAWIKWGVLILIVWGSWLCAEVWFNSEDVRFALPIIIALVLGLCLGGAIGYSMTRNIIHTCDELISQMED